MKLKIKLDMGEGPVLVETNLFVVVTWERKYKRQASDLGKGVGLEDLAFMAYESCKQNKIVVPAQFDEFLKKLVDLTVVEQDHENPTQEAPGDAA